MYTFWSLNQKKRKRKESTECERKRLWCTASCFMMCVREPLSAAPGGLYRRLLGASIGGSWGPLSAAPGGLYRRLLGASIGGSWGPLSAAPGGLYRRLLGPVCRGCVEVQHPVTHSLSSILHSLHPPQRCRWAGRTCPPSQGCLSYSAPDKTLPMHLPSSVGMGVHGRSHHLPHVRSTASIKDELLPPSHYVPIISFEELE